MGFRVYARPSNGIATQDPECPMPNATVHDWSLSPLISPSVVPTKRFGPLLAERLYETKPESRKMNGAKNTEKIDFPSQGEHCEDPAPD